MDNSLSLPDPDYDKMMLDIARQLAMGIHEVSTILEMLSIKEQDWQRIKAHPRFQQYHSNAVSEWNAAVNTPERVKLKASTMIENWLLEAHSELHNHKTPLNHRVELAKVVAKLGALGESKVPMGGEGGGFQLTINIGDGKSDQVVIRPVTTMVTQAIDHDDSEYFVSPNTLDD